MISRKPQNLLLPDFIPLGTRYKSGNYGIYMVRKSIPRFTKSLSLVLIGLVLTEIQAFKNVKNLQRNIWKFFTFLNACISVKTSPINTKLGNFVNLGVIFLTM